VDSPEATVQDIRELYVSNPKEAEKSIEAYLLERLEGRSPEEKCAFVEDLALHFSLRESSPPASRELESRALTDLLTLLLGQRISSLDLASPEISRKLAASLNTVFDTLNDLVAVIRATLLGEDPDLQTIRHIISADLRDEKESKSLESHLKQIKTAFLIASEASGAAAKREIARVLGELDPDHIASEAEKGLRFGFMRKAELFEFYKEKYDRIRKWADSERCLEDFTREFERACRRLFDAKGGLYEMG
jgi:hypothetical protein